MNKKQLDLIKLVTSSLRQQGYRYLAELDGDGFVIRIFKGLDES